MSRMRTLLVAISIVMALQAEAAASLMRIDLNKANQSRAALQFSLTQTSAHGLRVLRLAVPQKQAPLQHLWRIDVVMRKGARSLLHAPLATKIEDGSLTAELIIDPEAMSDIEIWIRTGQHAPLAETVYVIDVGSFK